MDTSKYCNFKTIFTFYILNYCSKLQFNKHTYKYKRKGNDQEINETIDVDFLRGWEGERLRDRQMVSYDILTCKWIDRFTGRKKKI